MDVDAATQTMIDNLPVKTGHTREEWFGILDDAGVDRHAAAIGFLKAEHGVSHGYANLIVTLHRSRGAVASGDDLVDAQYAGRKAGLRPVYDRLRAVMAAFGDDVEIAPKKTGVSFRRRKQFALVEAPSAARVSVGLNLRGVAGAGRLKDATGMCTHRVDVTAESEVDDELVGWLREAYERA